MIKVRNLTKKYGAVTAVDNISFDIEKGHVYGFLGPNGAGKSTTMNIITGCLAATSGTVTVNGADIFDEPIRAKRSIGYLPEIPPLYLDMTPLEYLEFVAEAKGVDGEKIESEVKSAITQTSIEAVSDRLIRNLSKGYRQRVGIAQALIGEPEVIILDEPTVGLDPLQIIEIRELIAELGKKHTVILSSHILSEISAVCDYVMIMSKGKLVASNTLRALTESYGKSSLLRIESRGDAKKIKEALGSLGDVISVSSVPSACGVLSEIEYPSGVEIRDDVFAKFAEMNAAILSMSTNQLTLEDVFIKLTAESEFSDADSAYRFGKLESPSEPEGDLGEADSEERNSSADTADASRSDDGEYKPMFTWKGDDGE